MGHKVARNLRIIFDEGDAAGAEIVCRLNVPIGVLMEISHIGQAMTEADIGGLAEISALFVDQVLVSWNLEEEDGSPIPLTQVGLESLPVSLRQAILMHWITTVVTIPVPLGAKSPNGNGLAERSIPMELLSGSPLN